MDRPICHATGCSTVALVHWLRRLTPVEVEVEHTKELDRRTGWPPELAASVPLTDGAVYSYTVEACGPHAIDQDAATQVHQATCSGPNSPHLPQCDCTPEPLPDAPAPAQQIPEHWT